MTNQRVLMRPPGDSLVNAVSKHPDASSIDPERARAQHESYRLLLVGLGVEVTLLAIEEDHPDSCFVADLGIVVGDRGLLCRPALSSRRGESESIEWPLRSSVRNLETICAPASLEGGDVLITGDRITVGRSNRTNAAGIQSLRAFAKTVQCKFGVTDVEHGVLHLLSRVSPIATDAILGAQHVVERDVFSGLRALTVPDDELDACNVVAIGDHVVMGGHYPTTAAMLSTAGYDVHSLDLSEFRKADGGPSCLTLFT